PDRKPRRQHVTGHADQAPGDDARERHGEKRAARERFALRFQRMLLEGRCNVHDALLSVRPSQPRQNTEPTMKQAAIATMPHFTGSAPATKVTSESRMPAT